MKQLQFIPVCFLQPNVDISAMLSLVDVLICDPIS